ncbi:MAG: aldo/keto reductase [Candidatus Ornithomonoglobus sp.]
MKYFEMPGLKNPVSRMVFGTAFKKISDGNDASDALDAAINAGVNTIDTARVYGKSEEVLGRWLAERGNRESLNIITKGCHHSETRKRVTPKDIKEDIAVSLSLLGTDYIDIYMLHRDDESKPAAPLIETLNELKADGKILVLGASNWTHKRIEEANEYAYSHNMSGFEVSSPGFSAAEQLRDPWGGGVYISGKQGREAREWYIAHNMPIIAYSSLARGYLSGKYKTYENKTISEVLGSDTAAEYDCEENRAMLARMEKLSAEKNCTVAQLALAWLVHHPMLTCPVLSPSTPEHVRDSAKAFDMELTDEEFEFICKSY